MLVAIVGVASLTLASCSSTATVADSTTAGSTAQAGTASSGTTTAGGTEGSTTGSVPVGGARVGPAYTSAVYARPESWLCRPELTDDPCHQSLDATVVNADGSTSLEPFVAAVDPKVDCFYVYPTVSTDDAVNSDMIPNDEERNVVVNQAARLRSVCRLFAPMYRQRTLGALFGTKKADPAVPALDPYGDVVDAWKQYLANDNHGRGVVLIGHSQGTGMLTRLIKEEIDKNAEERALLVSALLIGGGVNVPEGADVGGDFANIALCRAPTQTGCVIAYSTFRSTSPPPDNSKFGKPRSGTGQIACTNPAALGGGAAELRPYSRTKDAHPFTDPAANAAITTPFVTMPGLLRAECVFKNGFSYLELTVQADPNDPRTDTISGDLTPDWGLHVIDVNIAMGDLVNDVVQQAQTYVDAH